MMTPRITAIGLAAGLALALLPAGAQAQVLRQSTAPRPGSMGVPQPEPPIKLDLQQKTMGRILNEMFKQASQYRYRLLARQGTAHFSLKVDNVPLTQALKMLLAQDKSHEPMVYYFTADPAGGGTFTIDREYIQIGEIEGENRVSLANARITEVLPRIFALTKVKYRIEPDVPPVPISLQLRPTSWTPVAAQVILEASKQEPTLTYSLDGDTLVVHIQKAPTGLPGNPAPEDARRVKMTVENQPLRAVLGALFKESKWKYEVSKDVQDVRISYTSTAEPELGALHAILKQAAAKGKQVTYREGKGVLYIERGPLPGAEGLGEAVAAATVAPTVKTASLTVLDQRLKRVTAELATLTGSTITVAPNVPDLPVSVRIVNLSAELALGEIVKSLHPTLPNLMVRVAGPNTYVVELGAKK